MSYLVTIPFVLLWRCCIAPVIVTVGTFPFILLSFPIGIVYMAAAAVVHYFSASFAVLFIGFVTAGYLYYYWPKHRWLIGYQNLPGRHYLSLLRLVATLWIFVLMLMFLPDFQPVLRFLSVVVIAYFLAAVSADSLQGLLGVISDITGQPEDST